MSRLDGKTALVTDASSGIGRAIAIELAGAGAQVAINYQSSDDKANVVESWLAINTGVRDTIPMAGEAYR